VSPTKRSEFARRPGYDHPNGLPHAVTVVVVGGIRHPGDKLGLRGDSGSERGDAEGRGRIAVQVTRRPLPLLDAVVYVLGEVVRVGALDAKLDPLPERVDIESVGHSGRGAGNPLLG